jgi:hypothetical protein
MSLFGGAGLGVVLYYLGQVAINEGVIRSIEESANGRVQGLEAIARWLWIFALIPVLKGLAQIIYAAFFADSISKLADRFAPPQPAQIYQPQVSRPTMAAPITGGLNEAPPSVTENTTQFFDPAARPTSESQ